MEMLERYVCVLHNKTTPLSSVNELRKELFCKRAKTKEMSPPTQVKLMFTYLYFVSFKLLFYNTHKQSIFIPGKHMDHVPYEPHACNPVEQYNLQKDLGEKEITLPEYQNGSYFQKWQKQAKI